VPAATTSARFSAAPASASPTFPISERTAFALLQVELGCDLKALREKLELDARQMVALRMRARRLPPVARGKGTRRKRRGKPGAS